LEIVELIKLSPRKWDSSVNVNRVLRHISWTLSININVIAFKVTGREKCLNHGTKCFTPFYYFQNPIIKLILPQCTDFSPVYLVLHKKKYYSITDSNVNPILINQDPEPNISFKNQNLTYELIHKVLQNEPLQVPFSIAIYSSFTYVRTSHQKVLQKNIIGLFNNNESNDIIHLFLTPHLWDRTFSIHCIFKDHPFKTEEFNKKNIFSNNHIIEGGKVVQNKAEVNKDLLNQDFCICEHPDTERYFSSNKTTFKNLATSSNQKNFLVENLGTSYYWVKMLFPHIHSYFLNLESCGLLTDLLRTKLQICSEISILR
jgi:hypothetical protein